jgi:putative SOS response-associated peptidase YedK
MCNLYSLNKKRDAVARFFRVAHNRSVAFEPVAAIFPGHVAPVIRRSTDGDREIVLMSWGFVLPQNEDPCKQILVQFVRGTALPGTSLVILRAKW